MQRVFLFGLGIIPLIAGFVFVRIANMHQTTAKRVAVRVVAMIYFIAGAGMIAIAIQLPRIIRGTYP